MVKSTVMALVLSALMSGCGSRSRPLIVKWDFSSDRDFSCLSHGEWLKSDRNTYQVSQHDNFAISILISGGQEYIFRDVRRVTVKRKGSSVSSINVSSYGLNKADAIKQLIAMHNKWQGDGTKNLQEWKSATNKGSLKGFVSTLANAENTDKPLIRAEIRYNFGDQGDKWFIITSFFWQPDEAVEPRSTSADQ